MGERTVGVNITYMGTKRALIPIVSEVIHSAQKGTLLDAFSGMCAVGEAVSPKRQVWTNDVQIFAAEVGRALFMSRHVPLTATDAAARHFADFKSQKERLSEVFSRSLRAEACVLAAETFSEFARSSQKLNSILDREIESCRLRTPHLFSKTYSGTFFGIGQAIEADALYAAFVHSYQKRIISRDEHRWCMIALGRTLLKLANSTGHFAQYLKPKKENFRRYLALRRRSMWVEWLNSLSDLAPIRDDIWRSKNKVFNEDCLRLLPALAKKNSSVGVIYADPPYTDDQYSRYYHVLETLFLYDYPSVTGAGLYRPNRFHTPFSLKSKVHAALETLSQSAARTGADLVLSYPTTGLATKAGADIRTILKKHFRTVETCRSISHTHSTFGASKGSAHTQATELIYLARSA
jgi:adenine-specific DNA-methyltransferase